MRINKLLLPNRVRKPFYAIVLLAICIMVGIQLGCFKDEPGIPGGIFNVKTPALTLNLDSVTRSEFYVSAILDTPGNLTIIRYGFVWDAQKLNPDVSLPTILEYQSQAPGTFNDIIRNLDVYSTYYVRAFVETKEGITYSEPKNFTTEYPWLSIPELPANSRSDAVGFSIGDKGYVGTGLHSSPPNAQYLNDFWEYDPASQTWTQKADFDGAPRVEAVGFGIGNKGYIGTGRQPNSSPLSDFWEYDPLANSWVQKADFAGGPREQAVGFSIGNNGYIGTGSDGSNTMAGYKGDFWEYDPAQDSWAQKADVFPACGVLGAVGFSIGSKGYIGAGELCVSVDMPTKSAFFKEFDPLQNSWSPKSNLPLPISDAVGFGIGNFGYVGTGSEPANFPLSQFWQYNPSDNSWKNNFELPVKRTAAVGFAIGLKAYVGTGIFGLTYNTDFWEYAEQ